MVYSGRIRPRTSARAGSTRTPDEAGSRLRPTEEVGFDLADHPAAELDVAAACALVAPLLSAPVQPRGDVVGHDTGRSFGEHAGLGDWGACDIADRVDIPKARREVGGVHGHPPVNGNPGLLHHLGNSVHGDPDEQVVGDAPPACESRELVSSVELSHEPVGHVLDPSLLQCVEDAL
jgi:hypothetical protein